MKLMSVTTNDSWKFCFSQGCPSTISVLACEIRGFLESIAIPRKTNVRLSHFPREKPLVSKVCGTIWSSLQFRISKAGVGEGLHRVLASHFYHRFSFLFVESWHCLWQMQDRRHAICLWSTLEKVLHSEIGFEAQKGINPKGLKGFVVWINFSSVFFYTVSPLLLLLSLFIYDHKDPLSWKCVAAG